MGRGYEDATGTLRVHMVSLRKKLEADPARPRLIGTEPGIGYRLHAD
jgi:two-component system KDP operon response regulator KdpE